MNTKYVFGAILAVSLIGTSAYAKDYTVKELNTGPGGTFVFDPNFLQIQPGDSVHFVAVDAGHDSQSYLVPKGAQSWTGQVSKDITVKFTQQGVYLYECNPHHMFGMLGIIQVDKAVNKAEAEQAAADMKKQQIMNQGRLEGLMKEIK
ncbi:MAG: plastocyanin/azurin family copper-binding protein [Nitrososphaerales archaeon]